jgi:hypothetical protein
LISKVTRDPGPENEHEEHKAIRKLKDGMERRRASVPSSNGKHDAVKQRRKKNSKKTSKSRKKGV